MFATSAITKAQYVTLTSSTSQLSSLLDDARHSPREVTIIFAKEQVDNAHRVRRERLPVHVLE